MSTTVLDVAESTRAMFLRHVFVHLRGSTPTDGVMREGHGEYWIEEGGTIDPDSGVFNTLNCSWALENGKTVHASYVDRAGNRGAWEEHAVVCAAGDASDYDYEQYVANDGNNTNNGTDFANRVETVSQAITNMLANLATDEYGVIWVEGNETHTGGTLSIGNNKRTIHIRRRPGSSSTRPTITGFSFAPGFSGGLLVDDVNFTGSAGNSFLGLLRSGAGTRHSWDCIVRGATIASYDYVIFASDDTQTWATRETINSDFVHFEDCTFGTGTNYHVYLSSGMRRLGMRNVAWTPNGTFHTMFRSYATDDFYFEGCSWTTTGTQGRIRFIGGVSSEADSEARYLTFNNCTFTGDTSAAEMSIEADAAVANDIRTFKHLRFTGCRGISFRLVNVRANNGATNTTVVDGLDLWYCHGAGGGGPAFDQSSGISGSTNNVWIRDCIFVDRSYGGGTGYSITGPKASYPDGAFKLTGCAYYWATTGTPEPRYLIGAGNTMTEAELRAVFALERNNHGGRVNGSTFSGYVRASANISLATWQGGSPAHGQGSSLTLNTTFDLANDGVADINDLDVHLSTTGGPLDGTGFTYGYAVDADGHLRHASAPDAGPFEFGASATPEEPSLGEPPPLEPPPFEVEVTMSSPTFDEPPLTPSPFTVEIAMSSPALLGGGSGGGGGSSNSRHWLRRYGIFR